MTIEEIIKKAIEGGYELPWITKKQISLMRHRDNYSVVLLDPQFWQALGRAMKWQHKYRHEPICNWEKADCEYKKTHYYCPHQEHVCNCEFMKVEGWLYQWHSFINHLADGGTIEGFFEKL